MIINNELVKVSDLKDFILRNNVKYPCKNFGVNELLNNEIIATNVICATVYLLPNGYYKIHEVNYFDNITEFVKNFDSIGIHQVKIAPLTNQQIKELDKVKQNIRLSI